MKETGYIDRTQARHSTSGTGNILAIAWIQDKGFHVAEAKYAKKGTGYKVQDIGCRKQGQHTRNREHRVQNI
jgi:hypothetical protein